LEVWQLILFAGVGFLSGWVNVLAGGGSIFTVPVMVLLGLPGPIANGTNRIAIIAQSATAVAAFLRRGYSDWRLSASLAAVASVGAYFGAKIGVTLEGPWFDRVLALILIGVGVLMATGADRVDDEKQGGAPRNLLLGHALMFGAGIWGGFIQIGVGILMMPILYRVMGINLVRTNMHKVFITLMFSLVALAVFASHVAIAWQVGTALAFGNAIGGWMGAKSAIAGGAKLIKIAVYAMIAAMAVKLLFFR
jgi:hypothetical protein